MGSLGDDPKGQQPMLNRVKKNIVEYNSDRERVAASAPLWMRLLAKLPNPKKPFYDWQSRH